MKKYFKKTMQSIIFILKVLLYLSLLFSFLFLFSRNNFAVLNISRTMATTIFTYVFVGLLMTAIYGRYDIGRRKSKPIIYSLVLATLFTDFVAYIQLMIMNTITPNVSAFKFSDIGTLALVIVVHVVIIIVFVYIGNGIFFAINDPESCCVITTQESDLSKLSSSVKRYKKQYCIKRVVDYRRKDLYDIIKDMDTVFIYDIPSDKKPDIINFCYERMINIYINPDVCDLVENVSEHYLLDDVSFLNHNISNMTFEQRVIKRIFDIIFSLIFVVISSPIWIVSSIAIKLGDGGTVFFKQKRATQYGRVFYVYKFRTMKEHVENRSATSDDDRITKVGKVLRKTRLDEVPQLFNILKGDMSFVGPRPEMLENVKSYTSELPEFKYRLRAKAGLTGYAQIAGKYNTSPKDKLILDMMYIENYSFRTDIKLLFQTAIVLLKKDSTEGFQKVSDCLECEKTPENLID